MSWIDRMVFLFCVTLFMGVACWIGLKLGERP